MTDSKIAIVGIATHLPGAPDHRKYWENLRDGVESVRTRTDAELIEAGVTPEVLRRPGYVKSASVLDGVYDFDAEFFGFSPKEAGILDPQHRHFLMAAWEVLEDAGHPPETFNGAIGLFAGCGTNAYYQFNILSRPELVSEVGLFLLRHTGNDKDFLATRASYLLDLHGPAVNVQTACSTSLVATHLAVSHLLSGEVDLAIAGGVTIEVPHGHGYQYQPGEILSPDGHCRAFDRHAAGTVFGSGVSLVALRRLDEAVADGDHIYAVIAGTAVNNDGGRKVGYLAPSVDGQAACVAEALAVADVHPDSLAYVECHGTGTQVGDPIEVAALTQAFRGSGASAVGTCAIGSVKTNIGHLDTAAGTASLVKVALALEHEALPPTLNFSAPSELIDFDHSPFHVNATLTPWPATDTPRRAGVNSLGVGGTNAFAVLESAPRVSRDPAPPRWRLLGVSGRTRAAADDTAARLGEHLARPDLDADLADVSWTLRHGRRAFAERLVTVARDRAGAAEALTSRDPRRVFHHAALDEPPRVALMFPGGGSQHLGMAAGLYRSERVFTEHVDAGLALLDPQHADLLRRLMLSEAREREDDSTFELMANQLPAIFLVEVALTRLLESWGVEYDALIGHSVGENTAACIGGTLGFADALGLVALRGRLMDRVGGGALAVPLSPDQVERWLERFDLDLAVVNAPDLCVVTGPRDRVEEAFAALASGGHDPQRVRLNVAAHSRVLDPVLEEFRSYLDQLHLSPPRVLWVSNRTGTWITPEEATDPEYWVGHVRHTVRFSDGLTTLSAAPTRLLLEVGPGRALSSLARLGAGPGLAQRCIPTMRHPDEVIDDEAFLLAAMGRLWACGLELPSQLERRLFDDPGRSPRRVSLPTYAFQTQPYFIAPQARTQTNVPLYLDRDTDPDRWHWEVVWRSRDVEPATDERHSWLIFADRSVPHEELSISLPLIERLRQRGESVVVVELGDSFQVLDETHYVISPENAPGDCDRLVRDLARLGQLPDRVAMLSLLAQSDRDFRPGGSFFQRNIEVGFELLVSFAQAWVTAGVRQPLHVVVVTMDAHRVVEHDLVQWPEQSTVLGPALVMPRELPDVTCSVVDISQRAIFPDSRLRTALDRLADVLVAARHDGLAAARAAGAKAASTARFALVGALVSELTAPASNDLVALRGGRRLVRTVQRRQRACRPDSNPVNRLRRHGVVLITGGLGGIGLHVARWFATERDARVVLMGRTPLPERGQWDEVIERLGPDHPTRRRIEAVRAIEADGTEVLVVAGDVTNPADVRSVVQLTRERFGSLDGVVHAAGVLDDAPLATKTLTDLGDVMAPKVYGTIVLDEATQDCDLDVFVLFSSTSTVLAPAGQTDYVAANAFLNSWAEAKRASGRHGVVAINWGVWRDAGMVEQRETELDSQSTITDRHAAHPFFDSLHVDRHGLVTLVARWDESRWFLDEHRTLAGAAILPGSAYPEMARAALQEIGYAKPFEIEDLTFIRPLGAATGEASIRLRLVPTEYGYAMEVDERVRVASPPSEARPGPERLGWRRTAEARLVLRVPEGSRLALSELVAGTEPAARRTAQHDHLRFGPRWNVVQWVRRADRRAVARLALAPEARSDRPAFDLHPALMDLGTGFAIELVDGYTGDALWVPVQYGAIRVLGPLPDELVAVAWLRPGSTEARGVARFDVRLCASDGTAVVEVDEFTMKRLEGDLEVATASASGVDFDDVPERALTDSELVLAHNVSQGITSSEGVKALGEVLDDGCVVAYVSSLDVAALRAQTTALSASAAADRSETLFGRPDLANEYVGPRNAVESSLVEMWQELLGVDQVGVFDDFFALGGHSLIAVRLFARIRSAFSVDFPISLLLEAPTVADVAARIEEAAPIPARSDAGPDETPAVSERVRRYRHLVPMHAGEGGARLPLFVVAGMFGNVMNLRQLAHQIGGDRPFYGLQARGLFGDGEPHEEFEAMAKDYLSEVREVQPHGPYLLGGFSGGGIAAYEMAQQLHAAGEAVGLLVMLDTPLPSDDPLTMRDRLAIQRDNLQRSGIGYLRDWAVNRVRWERERWRREHVGDLPVDEGSLHSERIARAFYRALARYDLQRYPGRVTLFRPRLTPLHVFGPDRQINVDRRFIYDDNGWGRFVEEVVVTEVPGTHDSMVLEPNVRVLARHLRAALLTADGTGDGVVGALNATRATREG